MSDYLAILAKRSLGVEPAIRPRREVIAPAPGIAALDLELEEEVPGAPPGPARRAPRPVARDTTHPQSAMLRTTTSTEVDPARQPPRRERGGHTEQPRPAQTAAAPDPRQPVDARPSRDPRAARVGRTRQQDETVEAPVRAPRAVAGAETEPSDAPTRPAVEHLKARDGLPPARARRDPAEAAIFTQPGEAGAASSEPVPPAARPAGRRRDPGEPAAVRTTARRRRLAESAAAPPPAREAVTQLAAVDSGRGAEPPVRVTIGRVDVVASRPAPAPAPRRRAPATSLDDYLRARWGERR